MSQIQMSAASNFVILQDPPADVVVSFPDDYPNSVRHFLMVGFFGMLIGAGIFLYFGYVFVLQRCASHALSPRWSHRQKKFFLPEFCVQYLAQGQHDDPCAHLLRRRAVGMLLLCYVVGLGRHLQGTTDAHERMWSNCEPELSANP